MKTIPYQAVIFDLDGLVLDSESGHLLAWRLAAAQLGYNLDTAFLATLSGLPMAQVENRLREHCGNGLDLDVFHQFSRQHWLAHVQSQGIAVKKGFFSLIERLTQHKLPFCLATNSPRQAAMLCLELAGLQQVFSIIITIDDVPQGKPAPDIFLKAATQLNVDIAACLILEDSPVGVDAAIRAGAACIYIPSTYPHDRWAAENSTAVVDDLEQAVEFISTFRLQN